MVLVSVISTKLYLLLRIILYYMGRKTQRLVLTKILPFFENLLVIILSSLKTWVNKMKLNYFFKTIILLYHWSNFITCNLDFSVTQSTILPLVNVECQYTLKTKKIPIMRQARLECLSPCHTHPKIDVGYLIRNPSTTYT